MTSIKNTVQAHLGLVFALAAATTMLVLMNATGAFADADTLTGIDPEAKVTSILTSAKLWIAAGVGVFVLGAAVTLGKRYVGKFGVKG